jgi:hypothetical protein
LTRIALGTRLFCVGVAHGEDVKQKSEEGSVVMWRDGALGLVLSSVDQGRVLSSTITVRRREREVL